jgi:hypothetical protein
MACQLSRLNQNSIDDALVMLQMDAVGVQLDLCHMVAGGLRTLVDLPRMIRMT